MAKYPSIGKMFLHLVPDYKGRSWRPFVASFPWDPKVATFIRGISPKRYERRIDNYLIPGELQRSRGSIRFGNSKEGHGYKGRRGDFCLIGGCYDKGHLSVFYRRLELVGGLHYDLAIFSKVSEVMPIRRITLFSPKADVFAPRGNSNEKLYYALIKLYGSSI